MLQAKPTFVAQIRGLADGPGTQPGDQDKALGCRAGLGAAWATRTRRLAWRAVVWLGLVVLLARAADVASANGFSQPDPHGLPGLYVWSDTCNVYVLRDGDAAVLIDLGDGSVLEQLPALGVKQVEWVLFTHHHREQCQGYPRLAGRGIKAAGPAAERALFEEPTRFRKVQVRLNDPFTVYGASYVRPPVQPIRLDRLLSTNDIFQWRGWRLRCLPTPGNSPGSLTYLLQRPGGPVGFSGDVMLAGGRLHTWFDTEWDYGYGAGLRTLQESVQRLIAEQPAWLCPAHGPVVRRPGTQLRAYAAKLEALERLYVRGYPLASASATFQDRVSRPTVVSNVWQVSPHLFKFKWPNGWPNFGLILADNGHGLVVDCGLVDEPVLESALQGLRKHFGLKTIDAVLITHMHGDHMLQAPYVRQNWGAEIWALDRMRWVCERPEWFDYAAPLQAYGKPGLERLQLDRLFRPGETFVWGGWTFTVDWLPGQTEFGLCVHVTIDGRKVAFTGDNLFGDPQDPSQTGHEAVVAHNSAVLEEGYIHCAEYLHRLQPDLLMGGHSFVMDRPAGLIQRFRRWAYQMRDAFRDVLAQEDYRYGFDPFWVRAEPYRVKLQPGGSVPVLLNVRNFVRRPEWHRIVIATPPGLQATPAVLEGGLPSQSQRSFVFRLTATSDATPGIHLVAFDVTRGGQRYGQWFDLIVQVEAAQPKP